MKTKLNIVCGALWLTMAAGVASAQPTAFDLASKGDRYIGEQSKDKVVEIRSDRSANSLVPQVWHIVYYDPDAPLKAVEVKFGGGEKMDVSRPLRLLEPITGNDRVIDSRRMKIDSDRALDIARHQPVLSGLSLTSAQYWLQHGEEGPQWKIEFWAAKTARPQDQADLGYILISASDGAVIRTDFHPDRVN